MYGELVYRKAWGTVDLTIINIYDYAVERKPNRSAIIRFDPLNPCTIRRLVHGFNGSKRIIADQASAVSITKSLW